MDKKSYAIIFLSILTLGMGISDVFLILNIRPSSPLDEGATLNIGTSKRPYTLEPINSWDEGSNVILEQVVETLFFYDLYDLDLPRINLLAESYFWESLTSLQIKLREGIRFHDGTPFNADAAKWNLDRLLYLTNCTGTNIEQVAQPQSLWKFPDGKTPIMHSISTIGDYNITILLNAPYGPFLNTLAYVNAGMISPTAHRYEENSFISLLTGTPIGTGPYKYLYYSPGKEVVLSRWEEYWRNLAIFKTIKFLVYEELEDLNNAMLSHQIDCFSSSQYASYIIPFENISSITIKKFTEETGMSSLVYQYLGINNKRYNKTWRAIFSYAINYSYVIKELRKEDSISAKSLISPGFGNSYNESIRAPNYNITKARELMVSMGYGIGYTYDWQWEQHAIHANGTNPFLTVDYIYNLGNTFRSNLGTAIEKWFKNIGINVNVDSYDPFDPWNFLNYLNYDFDSVDLFSIGWLPDYYEPYNMLEALFNPLSSSNSAQVNDTILNTMMELVLNTTDDLSRKILYKKIQSYIAEEGFFHAPLYHPKIYFVHSADLYGIPYNAMGKFQAYGMRRG